MDLLSLIIEAKENDNTAMTEIINKFTPLVIKTARTIYVKGYEFEDLVQVGQASIVKAVQMYDTDRGNGFTTYVSNTITRSLYLLIRKTVKEINCCSLQITNEEGFELIELLPSEEDIEDDYVKREEKVILSKALRKLNEQDKEIIYWFFYENKSLKEYAKYKEVCYKTAVMRKSTHF